MDSAFEILLTFLYGIFASATEAIRDAGTAKAAAVALLGALGTALVGFAGSIGVAFGKWLVRYFRSKIDHHIIKQSIEISNIKLKTGRITEVRIYCLVVRYGTDLYFEKLASDQEKYEGRLQNRVLRNRTVIRWKYDPDAKIASLRRGFRYLYRRAAGWIVVERDAEWLTPVFRLPVHSRLGTQFKFFLEVIDQGENRKGILMRVADKIEEAQRREKYFRVKYGPTLDENGEILITLGENAEAAAAAASAPSTESVINSKSRAYTIAKEIAEQLGLSEQDIVRRFKRTGFRGSRVCYRVWFSLADFPRVRTADGLENNMAFPI